MNKVNRISGLVILMMFLVSIVNAQEKIYFKSGKTIEVKLLDDSSEVLIYKLYKSDVDSTFVVKKSEVQILIYSDGKSKMFDNISTKEKLPEGKIGVFIEINEDSNVHPTDEVWNREFAEETDFIKVNDKANAKYVFRFKITSRMGEARVRCTIFDIEGNELWETGKYRGTVNIWNKMGASLHGIRRCINKGVYKGFKKGKF